MPRSAEIIAHWHLLVDDLEASALDYYKSVEEALAARAIPEMRTSRVDWKEAGLISAKREYLRVERGKFTFDICAAPFGTSYFFSWWLTKQPPQYALLYGCLTLVALPVVFVVCVSHFGFFNGILASLLFVAVIAFLIKDHINSGAAHVEELILAIPTIGPIYRAIFRPATYYATDTRLMFQESVHRAVVEMIAGLREARGLRALSPDDIRPTMRDLLS